MAVASRFSLASIAAFLKWCRTQLTWKNLVLAYAIFNLKSVPFSWHVRLWYHLLGGINYKKHVYPDPKLLKNAQPLGEHTHPIFTPATVTSRAPLFETDYNLHKSNSTYFGDLDIARTVLVTNLYTPGFELVRREMDSVVDENGKRKYPPGRLAVMLGSVYCSFKREIVPYEKYEMQSKIAGWDAKWLYILTFFLRPEKRKGQGKTLLAVGISKYVAKKGRLTVRPEKVLRASGLLPDRPEGDEPSAIPSTLETPASGEGINAGEGLDEPLIKEVMSFTEKSDLSKAVLENEARKSWDKSIWTWERIEQERLRGLKVVQAYVDLDAKLHEEAPLR